MTRFSPDDQIWRNVRLATFDPEQSQPYGLLDGHVLIVRDGRIRALVPKADLSASGKVVDLGDVL